MTPLVNPKVDKHTHIDIIQENDPITFSKNVLNDLEEIII